MEEREIIQGKPARKIRIWLPILGVLLIAFALLMYGFNVGDMRTIRTGWTHEFLDLFDGWYNSGGPSLFSFVSFCLAFGILLLLASLVISLAMSKVMITVTNKRVTGCASWGRRVDLPLDAISAVSVWGYKGIAVGSSAGTIRFIGIENHKEIHETISRLLVERQKPEGSAPQTAKEHERPQDEIEKLKQYKELLDSGILTQEEFDAKKKQLLGL